MHLQYSKATRKSINLKAIFKSNILEIFHNSQESMVSEIHITSNTKNSGPNFEKAKGIKQVYPMVDQSVN